MMEDRGDSEQNEDESRRAKTKKTKIKKMTVTEERNTKMVMNEEDGR